MKVSLIAGLFSLVPILQAPAAVVYVTMEGRSSTVGMPWPESLGNGLFTARFSYDDSVLPSSLYTFENAVLSFEMLFQNGALFTGSGGDLRATSSRLAITRLDVSNFPALGNESFTGNLIFGLWATGGFWQRLPTAQELNENYSDYTSWIYYTRVTQLVLTGKSFTAVPEPSVAVLGAVATGLAFRRRRS